VLGNRVKVKPLVGLAWVVVEHGASVADVGFVNGEVVTGPLVRPGFRIAPYPNAAARTTITATAMTVATFLPEPFFDSLAGATGGGVGGLYWGSSVGESLAPHDPQNRVSGLRRAPHSSQYGTDGKTGTFYLSLKGFDSFGPAYAAGIFWGQL
jgi:hypothetical protein